ncbi:hypothetical protein CEXT_356291 [Caerostris extrusa]|uniref:Uncharacterized protein n=1 Tax=Caerostris extrusa TaxID=172846 RepID=A0AAV4QAI9_CAEEX|nr:hypothetical protein CEXT_356291 [Caerostris extrusa]
MAAAHEINVRDYGRQFLRLGRHVTVVMVTDQGEKRSGNITGGFSHLPSLQEFPPHYYNSTKKGGGVLMSLQFVGDAPIYDAARTELISSPLSAPLPAIWLHLSGLFADHWP